MSETYNLYCDESCHLENDGQKAMVLGAVWCPSDKRREIADRIREIKIKHGLGKQFEIKWTKVSQSKLDFYLDVVDYFFDDDDCHFRALVAPNKSILDHGKYGQNHDQWYYKMYFVMLKAVFQPQSHYRVYIDIKDTLGADKVKTLHNVLCNNAYDYSRTLVERIQQIHSDEAEQMQLADLLIGALSYLHRGLSANKAKNKIIQRIRQRSGYELTRNTLQMETKFNLLIWEPNSR
jgi:hypothetical protein